MLFVNGLDLAQYTYFVRKEIANARLNNVKHLNIGFVILKQWMHSQKGAQQIYHDLVHVIGKHLWELSNDPPWTTDVEEFLPLLECICKGQMKYTAADQKKFDDLLSMSSLKKQRKLARKIKSTLDCSVPCTYHLIVATEHHFTANLIVHIIFDCIQKNIYNSRTYKLKPTLTKEYELISSHPTIHLTCFFGIDVSSPCLCYHPNRSSHEWQSDQETQG